MLLGPIFRVELVSIARRRRYFVLRTVYAALILFVLWTTYSSSRYLTYNSSGQSIRYSAALAASFFMGYSWLQILAILLVGPAMAAGTIATERERRTIEYLFATDLSNAEIILGKTFARLTLMGQYVLVGLPILFLFRLLGGIPAEALLAIFLSAAGTATMLTGLSIAVSVWSPKARDATVRIYLLLIAIFSFPAILHGFRAIDVFSDAAWQAIGEPIANTISLLNPISTLFNAMGNASAVGIGLDIRRVYEAVGSQVLLAVVSLCLATFAVRRVHLAETTRSAVKRSKWSIPRFRLPLGDKPMLWKEMFSSTSVTRLGSIGWGALFIILFGILAFTIWAYFESVSGTSDWQRNQYFQFLLGVTGYLGCGMLLLLGARSAGLIAQEKERDCWTSLLSTPLSGKEIILGKLYGNLYSARWMIFILGISWALGLLINPYSILPMLVTCGTFLLFAFFVTCLGLFFSLRSPTSMRAMGQTLGTLIFCGGGYLFCCCPVMVGGAGGRELEIVLTPCIPFLLIFPGMAFLTSDNTPFFLEGLMPAAYVFGMIGYLVAAVGLYVHMVDQFDRYAGRTRLHPDESNPFAKGA